MLPFHRISRRHPARQRARDDLSHHEASRVVEPHDEVGPAAEDVAELGRVLPLGHPPRLAGEPRHLVDERGARDPVLAVMQCVELRPGKLPGCGDQRGEAGLAGAGGASHEDAVGPPEERVTPAQQRHRHRVTADAVPTGHRHRCLISNRMTTPGSWTSRGLIGATRSPRSERRVAPPDWAFRHPTARHTRVSVPSQKIDSCGVQEVVGILGTKIVHDHGRLRREPQRIRRAAGGAVGSVAPTSTARTARLTQPLDCYRFSRNQVVAI
jgi:hypothetical protein